MKKKKNINKIWIIIGVIVLVATILAVVVRIRNLKKENEDAPVKNGEIYENYDSSKAEDLMQRYFEGMAISDINALKDVFYSPEVLTTFAGYNNMSEAEVIESLNEQIKDLDVEYRDLSIKEYSAYKEDTVVPFNEQIELYSGKKNALEAMYSVSVNYVQHTTIGWEDKVQDIRVYVTDGQYYIWPNTLSEE